MSRSAFASLGATQKLSTYFTRELDLSLPAGSTEFVNRHGARVGDVIANGINLSAAGPVAANVTLCALLSALPTDTDAAYDTFDWAYSASTS